MTRDEMMQKLQAQHSARRRDLNDIAIERRRLDEQEQFANGFQQGIEYAIDYLKELDTTELST